MSFLTPHTYFKPLKMKNLYLFLFVTVMTVACQPKPQPVDLTSAKSEVNSMMDAYLTAWNGKDASTLSTLLTEEGLFCGTDPTELMDKKMITDIWKQVFADPSANIFFTVDKRVIRLDADGKSAIVMEQHVSNPYTPNIPWRLVLHTVKTDVGWKIDFLSWNLIPKNADVEKLNKALE